MPPGMTQWGEGISQAAAVDALLRQRLSFLTAGMDNNTIFSLASLSVTKKYAAGAVIAKAGVSQCTHGPQARSAYMLVRGTLICIYHPETPLEFSRQITVPGTIVGELEALRGDPRACDLVAHTHCHVCEITAQHLLTHCQGSNRPHQVVLDSSRREGSQASARGQRVALTAASAAHAPGQGLPASTSYVPPLACKGTIVKLPVWNLATVLWDSGFEGVYYTGWDDLAKCRRFNLILLGEARPREHEEAQEQAQEDAQEAMRGALAKWNPALQEMHERAGEIVSELPAHVPQRPKWRS